MNPVISIVIPTCDKQYHLDKAVRSVLCQDFRDFEIIVVNDGTEIIKNKIDDDRISYIEGHANSRTVLGYGSGGYSRNIGIREARGNYIGFLDDDDYYLPGKLSWQLKKMMDEESLASCTNGYIGILNKKSIFNNLLFNDYYKKELNNILKKLGLRDFPSEFNSDLMHIHNFIITSTTIFDKKLLTDAGLFKNIKNGGQLIDGKVDFEDWELWRRIVESTPISYYSEPTIYYKRGSISKIIKRIKKLNLLRKI